LERKKCALFKVELSTVVRALVCMPQYLFVFTLHWI